MDNWTNGRKPFTPWIVKSLQRFNFALSVKGLLDTYKEIGEISGLCAKELLIPDTKQYLGVFYG